MWATRTEAAPLDLRNLVFTNLLVVQTWTMLFGSGQQNFCSLNFAYTHGIRTVGA